MAIRSANGSTSADRLSERTKRRRDARIKTVLRLKLPPRAGYRYAYAKVRFRSKSRDVSAGTPMSKSARPGPLVWLQIALPAPRLYPSFPCGGIEPPSCNARPGRPDRSFAKLRIAPQPLGSHVSGSKRFPIRAADRGPGDTGSLLFGGRQLPRRNVLRAFPPARDSTARARCSG